MNKIYIILIVAIIIFYSFYLIENNENIENIDYYLPKITWSYWDDKNSIPDTLKNILKLKNKNLPGYKHILLFNDTLHKYINKQDFPKNYNKLQIPAKTDWIRLYLLYTYGGAWLDASIIITKNNDINTIYDSCNKNKYELMAFYLDNNLIDNDIYTYIESWFLIGSKNSNIIKMLN